MEHFIKQIYFRQIQFFTFNFNIRVEYILSILEKFDNFLIFDYD